MAEEWRAVVGFEGLYEVSSLGRVRSISIARKRKRKPTILTPYPAGRPGNEYPTVTLCFDGRQKDMRVHALVLKAFVGPRPDGHDSRHLNNDRWDSRVENLQWGTKVENQADSARHGTQASGERMPTAKLKATDVHLIRELSEEGATQSLLAEEFGVSPGHISKIIRRLKWKSL